MMHPEEMMIVSCLDPFTARTPRGDFVFPVIISPEEAREIRLGESIMVSFCDSDPDPHFRRIRKLEHPFTASRIPDLLGKQVLDIVLNFHDIPDDRQASILEALADFFGGRERSSCCIGGHDIGCECDRGAKPKLKSW